MIYATHYDRSHTLQMQIMTAVTVFMREGELLCTYDTKRFRRGSDEIKTFGMEICQEQ